MEKTLVIIKPDAVNRGLIGEVLHRFERKGLKVIGSRKIKEDDIDWRGLRDSGKESMRTDARNCFYPFIVQDEKIIGFGNVLENGNHPKKQTEEKNRISRSIKFISIQSVFLNEKKKEEKKKERERERKEGWKQSNNKPKP